MESKNKQHITWEDFEKFEDVNEGNFEFDGIHIIKMMSASREHQQVLQKLFKTFDRFFEGSKCSVYIAPIAVVYNNYYTVDGKKQIEPDLTVTCDTNFVKGKYAGVPNIVVEVVSPNNFKYDYNNKKEIYEKIGVPEYWIVNAYLAEVDIYNLDIETRSYGLPKKYRVGDIVSSELFDDLSIELKELLKGLELEEDDISKFKPKIIKMKL